MRQYTLSREVEREENWWLQFLQVQYLDEVCYPFISQCAHLQHKRYNSPNDALPFYLCKNMSTFWDHIFINISMCNLVIIQSISSVRNGKITFYVYSKDWYISRFFNHKYEIFSSFLLCRGTNMTTTATNIMHLFDILAFSPKHTIGS